MPEPVWPPDTTVQQQPWALMHRDSRISLQNGVSTTIKAKKFNKDPSKGMLMATLGIPTQFMPRSLLFTINSHRTSSLRQYTFFYYYYYFFARERENTYTVAVLPTGSSQSTIIISPCALAWPYNKSHIYKKDKPQPFRAAWTSDAIKINKYTPNDVPCYTQQTLLQVFPQRGQVFIPVDIDYQQVRVSKI